MAIESQLQRGSVPSRSTGVRGGAHKYGRNTGKKSTAPRVVVTLRREGNGARVPTPCENRWNGYTRSVKWPSTWSSKYIVYYYTYTYYYCYYYCMLYYLHTRVRVHCRFAQYVFARPPPPPPRTGRVLLVKTDFVTMVMRRTRVVAHKIYAPLRCTVWRRAYCALAAGQCEHLLHDI